MRRIVSYGIPSILAAAAMGKLVGWAAYIEMIGTFELVQPVFRIVIAVLLPVLETTPFVLCLTNRPRVGHGLAVATLLMITLAVFWHDVRNIEPDCACFGLWQAYLSKEATLNDLYRRNGLMLVAGVLSLVVIWRAPRPPEPRKEHKATCA